MTYFLVPMRKPKIPLAPMVGHTRGLPISKRPLGLGCLLKLAIFPGTRDAIAPVMHVTWPLKWYDFGPIRQCSRQSSSGANISGGKAARGSLPALVCNMLLVSSCGSSDSTFSPSNRSMTGRWPALGLAHTHISQAPRSFTKLTHRVS